LFIINNNVQKLLLLINHLIIDNRLRMPEENWHGIPRNKILWYPTIDYARCLSCEKYVEYYTLGTFAFREKDGKKKPVVENPNNCVVLCSGCDLVCPAEAIKHPSKKETRELIKSLRKTYVLQPKGKSSGEH
jgi:NAD-dependent dihydropyrimidine dehydrogenase PreA subunit